LGFKDIEVVFECLIFKINILTHHAYNHLTSIRKKMSNASNVTSLILGTQLRLRQNKTCATLRIEIPWKSHIYIDLNIGHVIKTSLGSNTFPTRVRKCKRPTPNVLKWVLIMGVGSL
jgi:hypothetical protein